MNPDYSILIVDDDESTRTLVASIARSAGFQNIEMAGSGAEALSRVEQQVPEFLVLDLSLPDMDGIEILQNLTDRQFTASMSIIMLTASDEQKSIEDAVKLGADDYYIKPVKISEFRERLVVLVEEYEAE